MDKRTRQAFQENLRAESLTLAGLLELTVEDAPDKFKTALADMAARADDIARQIQNLEAGNIPVKIAVIGDFGSGKSSFINNVLQEANLCPVRADPTTSFVTTFTYATEEAIIQEYPDGKTIHLSREQYMDLVQTESGLSRTSNAGRFTFHLPNALLRGCELLDTPGFNNPKNASDNCVTLEVIKEADAFLYLLDAQTGAVTKSDCEKLKRIRQEVKEALIFLIISKADDKSPEALDRIKGECKNKHAALFDEPILSYTIKGGRMDINTREDIARLLSMIQRDRFSILEGSLDRRIRAHSDFRVTMGAKLESGLKELTDHVENQISTREAKWGKVTRRLEKLAHTEIEHLGEELHEALEQNLEAEEIEGTGWFYNDAKIVYNSPDFRDAFRAFTSFKMIKDDLNATLRKLFSDTKKRRSKACQEAIAKSVEVADQFIREIMKTQNPPHFGSYSDADEALEFGLQEYFPSLFPLVYQPWLDVIFTELASCESEYFEKHIEPLRQRVSQLKERIEAWTSIREDGQRILG